MANVLNTDGSYREYYFSLVDYLDDGQNIWFVDNYWNSLFRMDKENFQVTYVDSAEKYIGRWGIYNRVAKWQDRIILIPWSSEYEVCVIEGGGKKYIPFPCNQQNTMYRIYRILQRDRYVFAFTDDDNNSILRFDVAEEKWKKWLDWKEEGNADFKWLALDPCTINDDIYCVLGNSNYVIKVSTADSKFSIIKMEEKLRGSSYLKDDSLWVPAQNEKTLYEIGERGYKSKIDLSKYLDDFHYFRFVVNKENIWLFPIKTEYIMRINRLSGESSFLEYPDTFKWINNNTYREGGRFFGLKEEQDRILLFPSPFNGILIIDKRTNLMKHIPLCINMREIINRQIDEVGANNIDIDSGNWENDFEGYLHIIEKMNQTNKQSMKQGKIGRLIWETLH